MLSLLQPLLREEILRQQERNSLRPRHHRQVRPFVDISLQIFICTVLSFDPSAFWNSWVALSVSYDDLKDSTLFKLYLATHSNKSALQKVCRAWMPWSVTIYLACQDLTKSYINSKGGMTWFILTLSEKYDRVHHPLIQAYLLLLLLVSYSFELHWALKSGKSAI